MVNVGCVLRIKACLISAAKLHEENPEELVQIQQPGQEPPGLLPTMPGYGNGEFLQIDEIVLQNAVKDLMIDVV